MSKRRGRKAVDRRRYRDYQQVAEQFNEAARVSLECGYWTASGVLIVHAAIAFADAAAIKLSGQRSAGENHEDTIALLEECTGESEPKRNALNQLRRIILEKTMVSYSGELYSEAQTKDIWRRLQRFREWAVMVLER